MPCTKCEDGKYKWGKTGECKYDTKEACEKANPKKYNKMQPTPLGKKSYDEYAKELKEYNLSSAQRFEFKSIAILDKLEDQANAVYDAMPEKNDIEMAYMDVENYRGDIKFSEEKMGEAEDEVKESTNILAEEQEKMNEAKKEVDFWKGEVKTHQNQVKERKAEVKEFSGLLKKAEKEYATISKVANTQISKAKKIEAELKSGIAAFEKSAKDLGVNVSNKVSDYEAALANIREVLSVKITK